MAPDGGDHVAALEFGRPNPHAHSPGRRIGFRIDTGPETAVQYRIGLVEGRFRLPQPTMRASIAGTTLHVDREPMRDCVPVDCATSASSRKAPASNRNSSALMDVRRHASPIRREAGVANRASEISVPRVTRVSTAMRGMRVTPMPVATICAAYAGCWPRIAPAPACSRRHRRPARGRAGSVLPRGA